MTDQIHKDLRKHLRQKIKRAIHDHIDICHSVDIKGTDTAAGLADVLLQMTASYFLFLDLTPQQFGQLCHDSYQELQEERKREGEQKS